MPARRRKSAAKQTGNAGAEDEIGPKSGSEHREIDQNESSENTGHKKGPLFNNLLAQWTRRSRVCLHLAISGGAPPDQRR